MKPYIMHALDCKMYITGHCNCAIYKKEAEMRHYEFTSDNYEEYRNLMAKKYGNSSQSSEYVCPKCNLSVDIKYKHAHMREHVRENEVAIKKALQLLNDPDEFTPIQIVEAVKILTLLGDWEIRINPALAHDDRKGFQIFVIESKK